MTTRTKWGSRVPAECDLCQAKIKKVFVDGKVYGGSWGYMCMQCYQLNGLGLGVGRGQKYELDQADNKFYKVGG
jgi:hypothetical protein